MNAEAIARGLGGHRHAGYWTAKCPAHDDKSPSLSIRETADGIVLVKCHAGCDQDVVLDALRDLGLWPERGEYRERPAAMARPKHAEEPTEAERTANALRIWYEARHPLASPVETYLASRGCAGPLPEIGERVLRYHASCPFGTERHPAMVALMRDIRTDEPRGIHRTALDAAGAAIIRDGKKLKLTLGPIRNAAVKLSADEDVSLGLGVCEGIETGLSILAAGWAPVWALGNAGAISRFPVLAGIEALSVFADNDESKTGINAARTCAARWHEAVIYLPKGTGSDWADHWKAVS